MRSIRAALVAFLAMAPGLASPAALAVRVADALTKIRPEFAVEQGYTPATSLTAARNEFEAFQIVIHAGATPLRVQSVTARPGAGIPSSWIRMYREDYVEITTTSQGTRLNPPQLWPDVLVPEVDEVRGEARAAFPFDVRAGQNRVVYVEVLVPRDAAAGDYVGRYQVNYADGTSDVVPDVFLHVWNFKLNSTSRLPTFFNISADPICNLVLGEGFFCSGDASAREATELLGRLLLDHRVSSNLISKLPDAFDWAPFDVRYAKYLDTPGDPSLRLRGARLTSVWFPPQRNKFLPDAFQTDAARPWADHFWARRWSGLTFGYGCDEPEFHPENCGYFSVAEPQASALHAADSRFRFRYLLTTRIQALPGSMRDGTDFPDDDVDIICPNLVQVGLPFDRSLYDRYFTPADHSASDGRGLWWYLACDSHGCGASDSGWPDYVIDTTGVQNRAFEWLTYGWDFRGELYYETTQDLRDVRVVDDRYAWRAPTGFGGNGDGMLVYPGLTSQIGGRPGAPNTLLSSLRLKNIRAGLEDYEYLALLGARDPAAAHQHARDLFPNAHAVGSVPERALLDRRDAIARAIEAQGAYGRVFASTSFGQGPTALAWLTGDMDGDGRTDVLQPWSNWGWLGLNAYRSTGAGYVTAFSSPNMGQGASALKWLAGDMDGDRRTDLIQPWNNGGTLGLIVYRSTGTGYATAFATGNMGHGAYGLDWLTGDMDGDGRTDILQPWNNGGTLGLIVYRSTGSGYAATFGTGNMGHGSAALAWLTGDMDGDGRTDLLQPWNNNGTLGLIVYRSTGTGYQPAFATGNMGHGSGAIRWLTGDVDGDRRTDLIQLWNNNGALGVIVYRSTGTGYVPVFGTSNIGHGSSAITWLTGDMDGDGRTDIVQPWSNNGALGLIVYESTGTGYVPAFASANMGEGASAVSWQTVDMTGDRSASELVQVYDAGGRVGFLVYGQ